MTEKTTEQFEWLSAEVKEMNGTAVLWKAECFSKKQEEELIFRFQSRASKDYEKIQQLLSHKPVTGRQEWLENIIRQYADIRYHDYFDTQHKYTIHTQIEDQYKNRGEHS